MSQRASSRLFVTAAAALVLACILLALSAVLESAWLAVTALVLIAFALVQRDRYLFFQGAWKGLFIGVAGAAGLGFLFEKLV